MTSERARRHEAEMLEALVRAFEGKIYWSGGKWFSHDPVTGGWRNDRFLGRRLEIMVELGDRLDADPEYQSTPWPARLQDRPGQYSILAKVRPLVRQLPVPPDFPIPATEPWESATA